MVRSARSIHSPPPAKSLCTCKSLPTHLCVVVRALRHGRSLAQYRANVSSSLRVRTPGFFVHAPECELVSSGWSRTDSMPCARARSKCNDPQRVHVVAVCGWGALSSARGVSG